MSNKQTGWKGLLDIFEDTDDPEEVVYDPLHLTGVVMASLAGLGALYWLLWSLLVCEGGIFPKLGALAQIIFTQKTLADFGCQGYPHALGIFEGWIVNLGALGICVIAIVFLESLLKTRQHK